MSKLSKLWNTLKSITSRSSLPTSQIDPEDLKQKSWRADVSVNKDFIAVVTYSGYGMYYPDFEQKNALLDHGISNKELGFHIREALNLSRLIHPIRDRELKSHLYNEQRYQEWVEQTMKRFGYKTKSKLFTPMLNLYVIMENCIITFRTSHQNQMQSWIGTGKKGADYVVIPADSSDEEIGAAARLALSRCSSKSHYDPILEKLAKHD